MEAQDASHGAQHEIQEFLWNDDETTETIVEELGDQFTPQNAHEALDALRAAGRVTCYRAIYADRDVQEERTWWSIRGISRFDRQSFDRP